MSTVDFTRAALEAATRREIVVVGYCPDEMCVPCKCCEDRFTHCYPGDVCDGCGNLGWNQPMSKHCPVCEACQAPTSKYRCTPDMPTALAQAEAALAMPADNDKHQGWPRHWACNDAESTMRSALIHAGVAAYTRAAPLLPGAPSRDVRTLGGLRLETLVAIVEPLQSGAPLEWALAYASPSPALV